MTSPEAGSKTCTAFPNQLLMTWISGLRIRLVRRALSAAHLFPSLFLGAILRSRAHTRRTPPTGSGDGKDGSSIGHGRGRPVGRHHRGSSRIGFAIASVFIEEGAEVVANGRDAAKLEAACEKLGPSAHGVVADLTTSDGAATLHAFASELGSVEFLVNNVGRFEPEDFFEISDERWHEYFEANLPTGIRITRLVLREMLDRDSGSVAFIASEAAL